MKRKLGKPVLLKLEKIKLPPLPNKKRLIKKHNNKESSIISRKSAISISSDNKNLRNSIIKSPIEHKENPFELKANKSENLFQSLIGEKLEDIQLKEEETRKELEKKEKEKEYEELEKDIPLYIKYQKFQEKIDLSKKVKLMIPRIDDIEEFEKKIKRKHKELFKNIIPNIMANRKEIFKVKPFKIPPLLYEDKKYFLKRFGLLKPNYENDKIHDSNMIYPNIIDYDAFVKNFKKQFHLFNKENFSKNVYGLNNSFYENLLTQIKGNAQPKIVSFSKDENGPTLELKFQNYMNKMTVDFKSTLKKINRTETKIEENPLSVLIKKQKQESVSKVKKNTLIVSETEIAGTNTLNLLSNYLSDKNFFSKKKNHDKNNLNKTHSSININKTGITGKSKLASLFQYDDDDDLFDEKEDEDIYKETSLIKNDDKKSLILKNSEIDDTNEYLDNSYIFEENIKDIDIKEKFGLKIRKDINLNKKKVDNLYDKYIIHKLKIQEFNKNH